MILFKCDRCKQVISPYVHRLSVEVYNNTDYKTEDQFVTDDDLFRKIYTMHLCRDCVEQIAAVVLNYGINTDNAKNSEGGGTGHTHRAAGSGTSAAA